MGKIKKPELTPMQQQALENGYCNGSSHVFCMRCKAVLLKAQGLSSPKMGGQLEMHRVLVNNWVKRFMAEGLKGLGTRPGRGHQTYYRHTGRGNHPAGYRERPLQCPDCQGAMGEGNRKDCLRRDLQTFLKRIGAKFGCIRKRRKGNPSPQLCQYKLWELQ